MAFISAFPVFLPLSIPNAFHVVPLSPRTFPIGFPGSITYGANLLNAVCLRQRALLFCVPLTAFSLSFVLIFYYS